MDTFLIDLHSTSTQRRTLNAVFDLNNTAFKWTVIVIVVVVALLLTAFIIWAIVTKCGRGKSAPVAPADAAAKDGKPGDVERGNGHPNGPEGPPASSAAAPATRDTHQGSDPPPAVAGAPSAPPAGRVPPWVSDPARLPPGIMLAPVVPPVFNPLTSNPRNPTDPPYERLVLVSSRVHNAGMVAKSVLPNVAYVVYDWKNFTLQELLRYVKKVLGSQKVISLAVVAPGTRPGSVGLLEGAGTSPDKLASKTELSQFWRVLAGCVALSGTADGRRVDLIGCRVVEAPREGAALLKELWNLTTVPFAAADDALGGYMLCTFMEEPVSKQLSLIATTIPAIDLYFNRYALLGIPAPAGVAAEVPVAAAPPPPLPPGRPPPEAIVPVGTAPPLAKPTEAAAAAAAPVVSAVLTPVAAPARAEAPAAPPPAPPPPPLVAEPVARSEAPAAGPGPGPSTAPPTAAAAATDVFTRLNLALQRYGTTADEAFMHYDKDGSGQMSSVELSALMTTLVPDATEMDRKHFEAMMETDAVAYGRGQLALSRDEFTKGLADNVRIQELVRSGRDDDEVVLRLQEYLTDNEQILRDTFLEFDANGNGQLDHSELHELIANIPGLDASEKKFILAYLYYNDQNRDMRVSYDELMAALNKFGKPPPAIARHVPNASAPAAAAAAAPTAIAPAASAAAAAAAQAGAERVVQTAAAQQQHMDEAAAEAEDRAQEVAAQARAGAGEAAQSAQTGAGAAAAAAAAPLAARPVLAPLGQPGGPPLAPLGGRLAPLAPLGAGAPRPGALAPLAPLPGR